MERIKVDIEELIDKLEQAKDEGYETAIIEINEKNMRVIVDDIENDTEIIQSELNDIESMF